MAYWIEATEEVVKMAQSLIEMYHPHLTSVNIGFIFRSEPMVSKGRFILGQASKVSDRWRPLLKDEGLDFVIWVAEEWKGYSHKKKRALIDHELCHCCVDEEGRCWLRGHDIEEFNEIIDRHGLWKDDLKKTAQVMQQQPLITISSPGSGRVVSLTPEELSRAARVRPGVG